MKSLFDPATVEAPFFEGLTGQHYAARPVDLADQPPLDLELIHVQALHHRAGAAGRAPFSLLFRPADASRLRQGNYECDGPGVDNATIFLVPVRDPLRGVGLEAVFN